MVWQKVGREATSAKTTPWWSWKEQRCRCVKNPKRERPHLLESSRHLSHSSFASQFFHPQPPIHWLLPPSTNRPHYILPNDHDGPTRTQRLHSIIRRHIQRGSSRPIGLQSACEQQQHCTDHASTFAHSRRLRCQEPSSPCCIKPPKTTSQSVFSTELHLVDRSQCSSIQESLSYIEVKAVYFLSLVFVRYDYRFDCFASRATRVTRKWFWCFRIVIYSICAHKILDIDWNRRDVSLFRLVCLGLGRLADVLLKPIKDETPCSSELRLLENDSVSTFTVGTEDKTFSFQEPAWLALAKKRNRHHVKTRDQKHTPRAQCPKMKDFRKWNEQTRPAWSALLNPLHLILVWTSSLNA